MAKEERDEALRSIAAELARQDGAWAAAAADLATFEGSELHVPPSFFEELDDACVVHAVHHHFTGVRA